MEPKWYCRIRNQQSGPHTWAELQGFAERGDLTPRSLVRREDERTWMEAKRLQGLVRVAVDSAPPPPQRNAKHRPIAKAIPEGEPVTELIAELPALEPPAQAAPAATASQEEPVLPLVLRSKSRAAPAAEQSSKSSKTPAKAATVNAGATHSTAMVARAERRKAARKKLMILVGGTIATIILVGGVGWALSWLGKTDPAGPTTQTDSGNTIAPSGAGAVDSTVADSTVADSTAADSTETTTATTAALTSTKSDAGRDRAIEAIVQSIAPWRDASKANGFSTRAARLQILSAYFANPADVRPTTAAVDAAAETPPAEAAVKPASDGKRVLCVELRVVCLSGAEVPLLYNSWNLTGGTGHSPTALLLDSTGRPHEFVPQAKWADAARQTAPKRLQPGQSVDDLLVFEAPSRDEKEYVRLALKMSAMGQGDRYVGLQFPIDRIAASRPIDVESQRPTRAIGDPAPTGDGIMEDSQPQPAAKPAAPAVPVESPEDSLKALHKQIDKSIKGQKEARAKEVEELQRKEELKNKP